MNPQDPIKWIDIFLIFGQIVTWGIVIIGWKVIWSQIKVREDRREAWELITNFKSIIKSIEVDAINYWISEQSDPGCKKLAFQIKTKSKELGVFTNIFKLRGKDFKLNKNIVSFRKAVSGGEFESNAREKLDQNNIKLYEISANANKLIIAIEKSFFNNFK
jgi:hypothetical protein